MYFLLGFSLIFALLLVINILSSVAAEIIWRVAAPFLKKSPARKRSQIIFGLAVLPFIGALVFVVAFLIPAYLLFEPHKSDEIVSLKLALLALISLAGIGVAVYRIFGSWWTTRRLVANWLRNGERIELDAVAVPVYRIEHRFPVIAVVGAFRPRMFIAAKIFDSLSRAELAAAVAHEYGHLAERDNFKRVVLRISRDLLVFPFGKTLERAWAETSESAADEYAATHGGNLTALNLASALVKIVRIVPPGLKAAIPAGTFLIAEETEHISTRVRRLLQLADAAPVDTEKQSSGKRKFVSALLVGFSALVVFLAADSAVLRMIHDVTEAIVAALQ